MKTPREKFENDPDYRALVLTLECYIERALFTPSELREAAVFACIRYEQRRQIPEHTKVMTALAAKEDT